MFFALSAVLAVGHHVINMAAVSIYDNIEEELRAIEDFDTQLQVGMILDNIENPETAKKALSGAYDPKEVVDLRA